MYLIPMFSESTIMIRTNAAPHPSAMEELYGSSESLQIRRGSASTGWSRPEKNWLLPRIVNIRGAVSPDPCHCKHNPCNEAAFRAGQQDSCDDHPPLYPQGVSCFPVGHRHQL